MMNSIRSKTISLCGTDVRYILDRKPVKNINIRIKPDGIVYVSANRRVSENYIVSLLMKKSDFIISSLEKLGRKNESSADEKFVRYLGKKYSLRIVDSDADSVTLDEEGFTVFVSSEKNADELRLILKEWMLKQALMLYGDINDRVRKRFDELRIPIPETQITIKEMSSRWGSCNPSRRKISMNLRLMEYPTECIYGVFCHEYAHYIHRDHSKNFYSLLYMVFPDYKKWDKLLKE